MNNIIPTIISKDNTMHIIDYVKNNSRETRTKHINLKSSCLSVNNRQSQAMENLKDFLGLEGKTTQHVNLCHLCCNNSTKPNGFVCENVEHLYFGTVTENQYDIPIDVRKSNAAAGGRCPNSEKQKEVARKNGKINGLKNVESGHIFNITSLGGKCSAKSEKSMNKQTKECEYCGKISNLGLYARWHGKNCKNNPDSPRFKQ